MRIAVCVKSVPDPDYYEKIQLDPVNKTLIREGIPTIINPSDKHAIEEALRLKEKIGGEIIAFSMGPDAVRQQMLECLAMGCDQAVLISDRKVAGADTLATSYTLSVALQKFGPFDLVLAGNESSDGATSHVPSQLGEWLGLSHAANVIRIENEDNHVVVAKKLDEGVAKVRLTKPSVIGVNVRINEVRPTNAVAILRAKRKPMHIVRASDLPLDEACIGLIGSPRQNGELEVISVNKQCEIISGTNEEIADAIYEIVRKGLQ